MNRGTGRAYDAYMSMEDWQTFIQEWAKSKGWWEGFKGGNVGKSASVTQDVQRDANNYVASKLCLVHTEVSEAMEALRDGDMELRIGEGGKPEGFESELADVIIRVLDLAEALGMDMGKTMAAKMKYNETREHKHGGRAL